MSMVELAVVIACGFAGFFIVLRFLDARLAIRDQSKSESDEKHSN